MISDDLAVVQAIAKLSALVLAPIPSREQRAWLSRSLVVVSFLTGGHTRIPSAPDEGHVFLAFTSVLRKGRTYETVVLYAREVRALREALDRDPYDLSVEEKEHVGAGLVSSRVAHSDPPRS